MQIRTEKASHCYNILGKKWNRFLECAYLKHRKTNLDNWRIKFLENLLNFLGLTANFKGCSRLMKNVATYIRKIKHDGVKVAEITQSKTLWVRTKYEASTMLFRKISEKIDLTSCPSFSKCTDWKKELEIFKCDFVKFWNDLRRTVRNI